MNDYQILAKGIALAGCAIGAGLALIAGIGLNFMAAITICSNFGAQKDKV